MDALDKAAQTPTVTMIRDVTVKLDRPVVPLAREDRVTLLLCAKPLVITVECAKDLWAALGQALKQMNDCDLPDVAG